ncbi:MAG: 4Fe-4S binding protein [Ferrimicrobium sp.]
MLQKEGTSPSGDAGEGAASSNDPISTAVHLRAPKRVGIENRFASTDAHFDLTEAPVIGGPIKRLLKNRKLQFFLILPNQIIFWIVIISGIWGITDPGKNFGPAITWYLWFVLVFVMIAVVGRAWCSMCPFGGFGEWVQRRTFFKRTQKALGLGKKLPESWAGHGLVISVGTFIVLTWIEEFFNIAGPGSPISTSIMVIGIVTFALAIFLIFERRTFCRYFCPLSSLIGSIGSMGMVAGFRTKDRDVCLACKTKDCMRGGEEGFGCPWYTWPGSADSNTFCGLCSECYKACPSDNVGLFVQKPLTSVIEPTNRRLDVGISVALLFGLVFYQQYNALSLYATVDGWLNTHMDFPHYPNPVDYLGGIALGALVIWLAALLVRVLSKPLAGAPKLSSWFTTFAYGLIPVTGADYLSRQLPKFFKHVARVPSSVVSPVGVHLGIYNTRLLTDPWIVTVQVAAMGIGTAATLFATYRIARRDLSSRSARPRLALVVSLALVLGISLLATLIYIPMHAAS